LEKPVFQNLVNYIEQGQIQPIVAKSFSLNEIRAAQSFFLEKGHAGKIVLSVKNET
ncbi:zinc-binding dehydrogenase, partial [Vibrio amylolyticus]|uniref:zinc-binding dehydrogenase n=1 Tax=Vibrio amylolyticus TaxID=2847292 RepID=UPI00354B0619